MKVHFNIVFGVGGGRILYVYQGNKYFVSLLQVTPLVHKLLFNNSQFIIHTTTKFNLILLKLLKLFSFI